MNTFRHSSLRHKQSKPNHGFKILKRIIYLLILLQLFNVYYHDFLQKPDLNQSSEEIVLNIDQGENLKSIAQELKDQGIIKSKYLFLRYAKKHDLDTAIKPGIFRIATPQTIPSVLQLLTTYIPSESKITIPEGYKISQINETLSSKGLIESQEFTNCLQNCSLNHEVLSFLPNQSTKNLEGLLFPDTYFVDTLDFKSETLILKMLDNFQNHLPSDFNQKIQNLPLKDKYSALIMASIIEREVLSQKDKQIVSGILWKRYENNWPLGADATLLYLKDNNTITYQDLQNDNPYNTRKNLGLPPTPISNPGQSSIEAAINPTETEYWFYLTTPDTGEVIYAKSNEEHNQNKNKYL